MIRLTTTMLAVLVFLAVAPFSYAYQDDRDGVVVKSCEGAIQIANEECAIWDESDSGDGDHTYNIDCVDRIMNQYGYVYWTDYRTERKGHAHPVYNKYICVVDRD